MLGLEPLPGLRVVASPEAIDTADWGAGTIVLRLAPDEAFAVGAAAVPVSDEHAIVVRDAGYVGAWLTPGQLVEQVMPHVGWPLPQGRPAIAQGLVAGVPVKLWLDQDRTLLLCAAAYARELTDRLG